MHLFQLEIITINFHAFYITNNGTLLCVVTMTLIRQEKIENIFFLKQHICFLKKMNINHFYQKCTRQPKFRQSGLHYRFCSAPVQNVYYLMLKELVEIQNSLITFQDHDEGRGLLGFMFLQSGFSGAGRW